MVELGLEELLVDVPRGPGEEGVSVLVVFGVEAGFGLVEGLLGGEVAVFGVVLRAAEELARVDVVFDDERVVVVGEEGV